MGTYYRHTKTESIDVPYSFRCEQCLKDSGIQTAAIVVQAQINSNFRKLSEARQEKLAKMAHEKLTVAVKDTYRNAAKKQIYSSAFSDKCPYCGAPQSWAISGAKKDMFTTPVILLVVGVIFGVGCYFSLEDSIRLTGAVISAGICLALACGSLIYNCIRIAEKKRKTSGALRQGVPVIEWSAAEHLLR